MFIKTTLSISRTILSVFLAWIVSSVVVSWSLAIYIVELARQLESLAAVLVGVRLISMGG
jgi:hypothetical protein